MELNLRKFAKFVDKTFIEGGKKAKTPVLLVSVAAVIKNPWAEKGLWWDVRPHPGFGTVEVRVCDLPINYKEIFALVALIQALVVKIKKENPYPDIHTQILQSNKWQAARYGLEGVFVDPITIQKLTMRKAIENLCDLVEPTLISLGSGY